MIALLPQRHSFRFPRGPRLWFGFVFSGPTGSDSPIPSLRLLYRCVRREKQENYKQRDGVVRITVYRHNRFPWPADANPVCPSLPQREERRVSLRR